MSKCEADAQETTDELSVTSRIKIAGAALGPANATAPARMALLACRDAASQNWGPKWLERAGFETCVVSTGAQALHAVRTLNPSVVIVEAAMCDASGTPVHEALRQSSGDRQIPTLLLCAGARDVERAAEANVVDIIRRPIDWQVVSRRAALVAQSFHSLAELDNARTALRTALSAANDARRHLAQHQEIDPLTDLPTRKKFRTLLERALTSPGTRESGLTVLAVGLDRFHLVNEALGHDNGNRVITEVGKRLRDCLGRRDLVGSQTQGLLTAAVAKLGGVRFGLLITHADAHQDLLRLRSGLLEALSEPFEVEGQNLYLQTSIGAVVASGSGRSADRLLQNAETAMLQAKQRGGGFRLFRAVREADSARKLELDSLLRESFQRGEVHLEYQPLVDTATSRVVGAEALLRWNHPVRGAIPPAEFIPVAEESGLMVQLGDFVIESACRQLRFWLDAGLPPLRMAVNLSLCQLLRGDVVNTVKRALQTNDLDPRFLEFELSERGVMSRDPEILHQLHQFKALGVQLSIDDFGTGDSAIAYLKDLPIDTLKIDRSYVNGALNNGKDAAIASAMVALAHRLNLTVVAEGIESTEQLELFRSWGCHQYQGFHCSPAVPGDEFCDLLGE